MERYRFGHDMLYQKTIYYPLIEINYLFKFEIESSNFLFIFQLIVLRKIITIWKSHYIMHIFILQINTYEK